MIDSKEKKKSFSHFLQKVFTKEVPVRRDSLLSEGTETVVSKGRVLLTTTLAVLAIGYGFDSTLNQSRVRDGVINAFRGGEPLVEQVMPPYSGEVDYASNDFLSIKGDNLTYIVGPEIDATTLVGKIVNMNGSPLAGNPDFVGVNRLTHQGEEFPVYDTGFTPKTYSDPTSAIDVIDYARLKRLEYNKKTGWEHEGMDKVSVLGTMTTEKDEVSGKNKYFIEVIQENEVIGKIYVTGMDDYASFMLKTADESKVARWYLEKGNTIPWDIRKTNKVLFEGHLNACVIEEAPVEQ